MIGAAARWLWIAGLLAGAASAAETPLRALAPMAPLPAVNFRLNGEGPFIAIIDTGNGSVGFAIARSLADRLHLPAATGQTESAPAGIGGAARLDFAQAEQLEIAGVVRRQVAVGVTPAFDRLAAIIKSPLDGNIGYGWLKDWRLVLDLPGGRLRLDASDPAAPGAPFVLGQPKPLVITAAQLGRERAQAVFDTGASTNLVSPALARRLQLKPGSRFRLEGVAGGADGRLATLPRLAIGGAELRGVPVVITNAVAAIGQLAGQPIDLVLGQPLLGRAVVSIDYPARHIRLEAQP